MALTILGAYFVASYFILHTAIDQQRSLQRVITVSGQQRMYSQRIAMFADAMVARPNPAMRQRAEQDLDTSIRIFSGAHQALTHGDPKINPMGWEPPKVKRLFFAKPYAVDRQVHAYLAHARALDERAKRVTILPNDKDLEYLLSVGPGPFLKSLDQVVAAYNDEQRATIAKFEILQLALLLFGLTTLAVIWFTILMPMEREIRRRTRAMRLTATTDSLTGILNRKAFVKTVETTIAQARRASDTGAMLMIDIDIFKTINDTYGHAVGDATIVHVAEILRSNSRTDDALARLGGDEFAVFAPAFKSDDDLRTYVDRLCNALQFDQPTGDRTHRVTASLGVARIPADATTFCDLMNAADEALYSAKRAGRARYAFSDRMLGVAEAARSTASLRATSPQAM